MKRASNFFNSLLIIIFLLLFSCSDDNNIATDSPEVISNREVKIAVVLKKGDRQERVQRILDMARENITMARGGVVPSYEYYDEDTTALASLAVELASRQDIAAVVGCYDDKHTKTLAYECAKTDKTMFTFNTSQELARIFGQHGNYWGLSESDITQCEILLSLMADGGVQFDVALLACDNDYGQTFVDWFAFQAAEMGLNPVGLATYKDKSEIPDAYLKACANNPTLTLCVPNNAEEASIMYECTKMDNFSHFSVPFFTDRAYEPAMLKNEGLVGLNLVADPASGFGVVYKSRFGEAPIHGDAELYDAIMLTCLASRYDEVHNLDNLNYAVGTLLYYHSDSQGGWMSGNMKQAFETIAEGGVPEVSGAVGKLDFDPKNYTLITHSTYDFWMVYEGQFLSLNYMKRSEGEHSSSPIVSWEWNKTYQQQFDEHMSDIGYPALTGNKAVIIAGSGGWENYRFQADALEYYQMLRNSGYSDDDIILIMADDLAQNANNPEKGVVRRSVDGDNLYKNVVVDYRLEDITYNDLAIIFSGKPDVAHPEVLDSGAGDNVLFFWSSHGMPAGLALGDIDLVSGKQMACILQKMSDEQRFRKMMWIVEACFSGGVAKECEGIPGLLVMTAANANESSKADLWYAPYNVYLTNRFTSSIISRLYSDPATSLRDLYNVAFTGTLGSHVTIYNADNYGNLYQNTMREFLGK
ncbi:MAG: C13 family peptidase [Prevotellaceae bacterium]|nr:C13 family peptidase [Prevotellaceae bacterium]MDY5210360.1 C13 family peptidase [Prevotella sp.]